MSIIFFTQYVNAQSNKQKDTLLVQSLIDSTNKYNDFNFKKALYFGDSALKLAKRNNQTYAVIRAYGVLADNYWFHSDFINAQKYYFRSFKLSDSLGYKSGIANSLYNIGWIICIQQHNYRETHYLYDANKTDLNILRQIKDKLERQLAIADLRERLIDQLITENAG